MVSGGAKKELEKEVLEQRKRTPRMENNLPKWMLMLERLGVGQPGRCSSLPHSQLNTLNCHVPHTRLAN